MKIAIGSDHGGYQLKESLKSYLAGRGIQIIDAGCDTDTVKVDYPDIAEKTAEKVVSGEADLGIMIDGAGVGSTMAATKISGIRAALCNDLYCAWNAREHNNANLLCMGSMVVGRMYAEQITDRFINTEYAGGRHENRVKKINALEKTGGLMDKEALTNIVREIVLRVIGKKELTSDMAENNPQVYSERVLTEDYLRRNSITELRISENTIILPMARDYISEKGIKIIK